MPEGAQSMVVDEDIVIDIAHAMAAEAKFLTDEGFDIIQIDEPFLSMPDIDLDLALRALKIVSEPIEFSALHVCGDISPIMAKLMDAPVDMVEVEGQHLVNLEWLNADLVEEKKKKICWGVISVSTNEVESVDEIAERIQAGVDKVGAENIWVSPDCGMRVRKPEAAKLKLERMVQAARQVEKAVS
jgi:5-methyltetrahydropteroyltriglutamate--homocysteine methyltransferase